MCGLTAWPAWAARRWWRQLLKHHLPRRPNIFTHCSAQLSERSPLKSNMAWQTDSKQRRETFLRSCILAMRMITESVRGEPIWFTCSVIKWFEHPTNFIEHSYYSKWLKRPRYKASQSLLRPHTYRWQTHLYPAVPQTTLHSPYCVRNVVKQRQKVSRLSIKYGFYVLMAMYTSNALGQSWNSDAYTHHLHNSQAFVKCP